MRSAIGQMRAHFTKCVTHLAIVGKFDQMCSAFRQMRSAFGQMHSAIGQMHAHLIKRCAFGQMSVVILSIGQMRSAFAQMRCAFTQMRRLVKCTLHCYSEMIEPVIGPVGLCQYLLSVTHRLWLQFQTSSAPDFLRTASHCLLYC